MEETMFYAIQTERELKLAKALRNGASLRSPGAQGRTAWWSRLTRRTTPSRAPARLGVIGE